MKKENEETAKTGALKEAPADKNWAVLAIPEDCRLIFVCTNSEVFDERQLLPMYDGRDAPEGARMPCFIGYFPGTGLKDLDILAGIPNARQASGQPGHSFARREP